jgi:hypothetical protein
MRALHYLVPVALGAGALVASVSGCELIAAVDRSLIAATGSGGGLGGGGGGTGGDATTGGGMGGMGGAGTGGSMLMNGAACSDPSQCVSGFCVDGVCCDTVCDQPCESCTEALKMSGADGECGQSAFGVTCGDPSCTNGVESAADQCDDTGMCIDGGTVPCDPFVCDANGTACLTMCAGDADCANGLYCAAPNCLPKKAQGAACAGTNECQSGFCVDGFCCNTECNAICQACSNAKKGIGANGTCGNVQNNQDPDDECMAGPCLTGNCSMGACGVSPQGTPDPTCMAPNTTCDAMGMCKLPDGASCMNGSECASGNCMNMVCSP